LTSRYTKIHQDTGREPMGSPWIPACRMAAGPSCPGRISAPARARVHRRPRREVQACRRRDALAQVCGVVAAGDRGAVGPERAGHPGTGSHRAAGHPDPGRIGAGPSTRAQATAPRGAGLPPARRPRPGLRCSGGWGSWRSRTRACRPPRHRISPGRRPPRPRADRRRPEHTCTGDRAARCRPAAGATPSPRSAV
jgi:hypothetical protein